MRNLYRQFVMMVPEVAEPNDEVEHLLLPDIVAPFVEDAIRRATEAEAGGRPFALTEIALTVTCRLDLIDTLPYAADCADQGGCAQCLAGRDFAKTYLMENPGKHLVIGLATVQVPG